MRYLFMKSENVSHILSLIYIFHCLCNRHPNNPQFVFVKCILYLTPNNRQEYFQSSFVLPNQPRPHQRLEKSPKLDIDTIQMKPSADSAKSGFNYLAVETTKQTAELVALGPAATSVLESRFRQPFAASLESLGLHHQRLTKLCPLTQLVACWMKLPTIE